MLQTFRIFFSALLILVFVAPSAQAGALEFFFPSLKKREPNPYETLRAPFADDGPAKAEGEVPAEGVDEKAEPAELPINALPLDQPHRVNSEIRRWVMDAVSEAVNLQKTGFKQTLEQRKKMFDNGGFSQYAEFLKSNNIMKVLDTGKYRVQGYVEDEPLLINDGVVSGRYRWLYTVPVVISYIDANASSYRNVQPVNQRIKLNVQVGRVDAYSDDNPHGLLIESWNGKVTEFENK